MTMREGERLICTNRECRCEVLVMVSADIHEGTSPRCSCGFAMKKAYTAPRLRLMSEDDAKNLNQTFFSKVS